MNRFLDKLVRTLTATRRRGISPRARQARPRLEELEDRAVPAIPATFADPSLLSPAFLDRRVGVSQPVNYAVLFNGLTGGDPMFLGDVKGLYQTLVGKCNVLPKNIYILFADGGKGIASNSMWDLSFATDATVLSGTKDHLLGTLQTLAKVVTSNDHFFFYSTDHGGGTENDPASDGEWMCTWPGDPALAMGDKELAPALNAIHAAHSTYVFDECFAGGMLDDLLPLGTGVFGCASCNHYEESWGDGFSGPFIQALQQGLTDTYSVFGYVKSHDPHAVTTPYPANGGNFVPGMEHPWAAGDDFNIFWTPPRLPSLRQPLYQPPLFDFSIVEQSLYPATALSVAPAGLSSLATPTTTRGLEVTGQTPVASGSRMVSAVPVTAKAAAVDAVFAHWGTAHPITSSDLTDAVATRTALEMTGPLEHIR
jgi:hypothetical protein